MNIIIALLLITLEGTYEGFKLRGWHKVSELIELIYLAGVTFVVFAFFNGYLTFPAKDYFYYTLIGYILFRYALFDAIRNISAYRPLTYIGNTKVYDILLNKLSDKWNGHLVAITKLIALLWGFAWLMGWQFGIK